MKTIEQIIIHANGHKHIDRKIFSYLCSKRRYSSSEIADYLNLTTFAVNAQLRKIKSEPKSELLLKCECLLNELENQINKTEKEFLKNLKK